MNARHDRGMATETAQTQITDHPERHRYVLTVDGKSAGRVDYRLREGDVVDLIHTEVDSEYEGRGLASKLARFALDDARAHGRKVIATCEYIAAYIAKHAEYQDLLATA
jgi:predicted GNAT family acetyltransferase